MGGIPPGGPEKDQVVRLGLSLSVGQFLAVKTRRCKIAVFPLRVELNSRTTKYQ